MREDEFLAGIRRRFGQMEGVRLQKSERALLEEAAWQAYREGDLGQRPKAMTGAQRKKKFDLLAKWEQALKNLVLLDPVTFPSHRAWFREKDIRRVLDRKTVTQIVRLSIRFFGKEYADEILPALKDAYMRDGEEIVIQRKLSF